MWKDVGTKDREGRNYFLSLTYGERTRGNWQQRRSYICMRSCVRAAPRAKLVQNPERRQ